MSLVRWDPFRELSALQNSISRLFDESFFRSADRSLAQGWMFPVDIKDAADAIVIKAELPGLSKEDIRINFKDNVITVTGERKQEEKEEGADFIRVERRYGSFSRSFSVDVPVKEDEIKARYDNGLLEITIPKADHTKAYAKQIEIE